jgi:hypothetical protein
MTLQEQAAKDAKACWKAAAARLGEGISVVGPEILRALCRSEIVFLACVRAGAGGGAGSYEWMAEVAKVLDSEYLGGGS